MGHSAASVLASIFMHCIESQISTSSEVLFWARYVDDVFLMYRPNFDVLSKANDIHPAIQFTLEESRENTLPFLDTLVSFDQERRQFDFSLYVKDVHSDSCLPFSACVPASRKRALLIGENHRVIRNSSDSKIEESKSRLRKRFYANGYPNKMIQRFFNDRPRDMPKEEDRMVSRTFLKLPFYASKYLPMPMVNS